MIEHLLRELIPQVLGVVARRYRDFVAAEDAVQEAALDAAMQWSQQGLPSNPQAWLMQVAQRRMVDHIRSESARRRREATLQTHVQPSSEIQDPPDDLMPQNDDSLLLLFMCCHPALTSASAIALTLRSVAGLSTAAIAHAFLVPETTMAQRISRAKQTIKASDIPFQWPDAAERAQRLRGVLQVLYLMFNEGYTSSAGPALLRADLSFEAIRLTRILYRLLPDDTEVAGLLALMLLTDARRLSRTDARGELIPLAEQDRQRWDQAMIAEGIAILSATLPKGAVGPYQLQAAIAAVHDEAATPEQTDWPQILALYEVLRRMGMADNPMVALSHAIASAMVRGPAHGLTLLDALGEDSRLSQQHRLDAARAHLLEMAGDYAAAIQHYRDAAVKTNSLPERNYLLSQAARLALTLTPPGSND